MIRAAIIAALVALGGCATTGASPNANGYLTLTAGAFTSSTSVYTSMLDRGRVSAAQAKEFDAKLAQPESNLLIARAALVGCPDPCDAFKIVQGDLRKSLLDLEKDLREKQAETQRAIARSRDANASRSLLSVVVGINDALTVIEAFKGLSDSLQGSGAATDADVDAAFARFAAARAGLNESIVKAGG